MHAAQLWNACGSSGHDQPRNVAERSLKTIASGQQPLGTFRVITGQHAVCIETYVVDDRDGRGGRGRSAQGLIFHDSARIIAVRNRGAHAHEKFTPRTSAGSVSATPELTASS